MYQVHKYIYPLSCVISFAYVHVEVTIGYTKLDRFLLVLENLHQLGYIKPN